VSLSEKLPEYMIPSSFVMLDAMPVTPIGKVDRSALPAPSRTRPELTTIFVAPRTLVEKELAQVWAELLTLEQVGIHDNFFDLGGHSLMATRVVSRLSGPSKSKCRCMLCCSADSGRDGDCDYRTPGKEIEKLIWIASWPNWNRFQRMKQQSYSQSRSDMSDSRQCRSTSRRYGRSVFIQRKICRVHERQSRQSIPSRFKQIGAKYPDRIAVRGKTVTFTRTR
jgi:hypothetical protein